MPGNLNDATFDDAHGRQEHVAGQPYYPASGDVIWSPRDAAKAWDVSPDTVVKYCVQGRCKHIKVAQEIIVLQAEKPEPALPGTLTPEQRAARGSRGRR